MRIGRHWGTVGIAVVIAAVSFGAWASTGAAGSAGQERLLVVSSVSGLAREVGHVYDGHGQLLSTLAAPAVAGPVVSLVWSPSGAMAAFVSRRGVWVERADGSGTRRLVRVKTKCEAQCSYPSVAWTPGGRRLAVGGIDPRTTGFELVNVATGRATRIGKPHRFVFYSPIAFSPNGSWLAYGFSGGHAGTASCCVEELVISRANGTHRRVLHRFGDPIHDGPADSTWSPDSTRLALTTDGRDPKDPRLAIVNVTSGRMHALNPHQIYDQAPAWSPDGTHLALAQYAASAFTVATNGSDFHSLNADAAGALWLSDGDLLLALTSGNQIDLLPGGQGTPQLFLTLPAGEQLQTFSEAR